MDAAATTTKKVGCDGCGKMWGRWWMRWWVVGGGAEAESGRRREGDGDGEEGLLLVWRECPVCHRRVGWGGQWKDAAGVRCVSAQTQTRPKFWPKMGPNGHLFVCAGVLGRVFYPLRPKRTRANEMGQCVGVGLR